MSVLELPEPPGWRGGRTFLALAISAVFGAAVFYAYWAVVGAIRGNYLTFFVAICYVVVLVLGFGTPMTLVALGRTAARTTSDATGFTVLPDRRFSIFILIGVVAMIPSGIVLAVFAPFGLIEFANSHVVKAGWTFAAGLVALTGISGLITTWRRGGIGHLKLAPTTVEVADILATRVFAWDDVVDVADHAESRKVRRAVVIRRKDGREEILSVADIYLPGGVALYWLVRHYWRHPEDRIELVDSRVAERLRDGRFDLE